MLTADIDIYEYYKNSIAIINLNRINNIVIHINFSNVQ